MKKTVIITGASRGIGRKTAEKFAESGYNVCFCYNNSEKEAKELEEKLSKITDVLCLRADVKDEAAVKEFVRICIEKFGKIDCLVNNAGISPIGSIFSDTDKEDWQNVFDVNLFGAFSMTKAVLPVFIHEKAGSVLNVSSIWGITGASCEVVYSSSKAALIGFTKALSKELALSGIRVNAVAPGVIDTDMNSHYSKEEQEQITNEIPLGRWGIPEDIAELIYFLASDKSSYITGQVITADGGFIGI